MFQTKAAPEKGTNRLLMWNTSQGSFSQNWSFKVNESSFAVTQRVSTVNLTQVCCCTWGINSGLYGLDAEFIKKQVNMKDTLSLCQRILQHKANVRSGNWVKSTLVSDNEQVSGEDEVFSAAEWMKVLTSEDLQHVEPIFVSETAAVTFRSSERTLSPVQSNHRAQIQSFQMTIFRYDLFLLINESTDLTSMITWSKHLQPLTPDVMNPEQSSDTRQQRNHYCCRPNVGLWNWKDSIDAICLSERNQAGPSWENEKKNRNWSSL